MEIDDDAPDARHGIRVAEAAARRRGLGGSYGGARRQRRREADMEDEASDDSQPAMNGGGGGGQRGGGGGARPLHYDPDEPPREEAEETVPVPLESVQWTSRYSDQLPVPSFCYMCSLRQDSSNPFYVVLQAIADAPTLDEEARCVHMAHVYATRMQNAGSVPLPDWKELAVYRHLTRHDVSRRRVLHSALMRATDLVETCSRTVQRARLDPTNGTYVLEMPNPNDVKTLITLFNFQRLAAKELAEVENT